MYSRYNNRPVNIPENYSGCAFSERSANEKDRSTHDMPRHIDVAKPTPPPEKAPSAGMPAPPRAVILPPPEKTERHEKPTHTEKTEQREESAPLPTSHHKDASPTDGAAQVLGGLFGDPSSKFPFAHGIGFDELLIIGLIILLSRSEQESDIVLWLALLLFMG